MGNIEGLWGDQGQAAASEEYSSGATVFPPGKHLFNIVGAELKQTKAGTGNGIQFEFEATAGNIKNWVNLKNPNEQAAKIGRVELAKIATVCGIELKDTAQLLGLPIVLDLTIYEDEWTNDKGEKIKTKKNKIKGYFPASEPTGAAQPSASAAKTDSPW